MTIAVLIVLAFGLIFGPKVAGFMILGSLALLALYAWGKS